MNRQAKLVELAKKSEDLIKKVIGKEGNNDVLTNITSNEIGDTVIFTLKGGRTLEYSISEISYIFEDELEGFEIFSKKKYRDIYSELKGIELDVEKL